MRRKFLLLVSLASLAVLPLQVQAMQCRGAIRGHLNAIGEGRRVFLEFNCSGCHGNAAGGAMGPSIKNAEQGDVSEAVLHGDAKEGGMPSFNGCATKTDVKHLVAYLRSIGTNKEPIWLDWWNLKP